VRWKTPIHGKGWSSPVIWDERVWLTTATEDGHHLFVVGVNALTGQIELNRSVFEVVNPQFCHKFNSYASPTPVVEDGRVYVTFGSPGTACLDTRTGEVLWERRDFVCNHFRGAGSSPILHDDKLILHFDGSDKQYVVALDKKTGTTVWCTERSIDFKDLGPDDQPAAEGDFRKAYATPHTVQLDGHDVLLSSGAKAHYAYDLLTGVELWRVEERTSHSASTRPLYGHGLIFLSSGFPRGQILAIRPGRRGEVIDANDPTTAEHSTLHLAWKTRRGAPQKPSLLLVENLLFAVEDGGGIVSCWEAKTGREIWQERIGGNYSAAPLYAANRVYCFSEEGKTTVLAANERFTILASNQLDGGFMASPAVLESNLILRTKTHLYRIGE
jgi:outer membrane protein assembly factor BamB